MFRIGGGSPCVHGEDERSRLFLWGIPPQLYLFKLPSVLDCSAFSLLVFLAVSSTMYVAVYVCCCNLVAVSVYLYYMVGVILII